jgi:hypothetical protein
MNTLDVFGTPDPPSLFAFNGHLAACPPCARAWETRLEVRPKAAPPATDDKLCPAGRTLWRAYLFPWKKSFAEDARRRRSEGSRIRMARCRARRKQLGLCRCGAACVSGRRRCQSCIEARMSGYLARVESSICTNCSNSARPGRRTCEGCGKKDVLTNRRSKQKRKERQHEQA